jgi:hypothetical protein
MKTDLFGAFDEIEASGDHVPENVITCDKCGRPFIRRRKRERINQYCSSECFRARVSEGRAFMNQSLSMKTDECIMWPFGTMARRARIQIEGVDYNVSRLICEKVYGPPPTGSHEAAHSCGKGHLGCINWKHLRWATHAENEADKFIHGTSIRGDNNGSAKLTEQDVIEIRKLANTMSKPALARRFGVNSTTISGIVNYDGWSWVVDPDFKYNGPQLF